MGTEIMMRRSSLILGDEASVDGSTHGYLHQEQAMQKRCRRNDGGRLPIRGYLNGTVP